MKQGSIYFEIQVDDIERAISFYTNLFGWKCTEVPGLPVTYFSIETENSFGGLLKRPCPQPALEQGTNAFTCSFEVKNFDNASEKILSLGGQVAMPKFAVPHKCWQGYFVDTEGNVFGIYEVDLNAK